MAQNLGKLAIRLQRHGCTNRPFYHLVVMRAGYESYDPVIEQIGVYDPMPNVHNEKIMSINFDRLRYWIGYEKISISEGVKHLLGLCGYFPPHPRTYMAAWRRRRDEQSKDSEKSQTENAEEK